MTSSFALRPALPHDHPALLQVWEASVRATHDFLDPADLAFFRDFVPGALGLLDVQLIESSQGPAGFIGWRPGHIEMLFVSPAQFGQGLGRRLLDQVIASAPAQPWQLDVNEQNPRALRFYQRYGFAVVGRSAQDSSGRPYPLLHLQLAERPPRGAG